MRHGASISRAARENGVTPRTIKRYAGAALVQDRPGGRIRATKSDRLVRYLQIPGPGGPIEITVRGSKQASAVAKYKSAVNRFLRGDRNALAAWHGKKIAGAAQRRNKLGLLIQGSVQPPPLGLQRGDWEQAMRRAGTNMFDAEWIVAIPDDALAARVAELVREKIMRQMGAELPYQITVEIEEFKQQGKTLHIHALILVERDGQKKIIIGEKGERIKRIGTEARKDMELLFDSKIMLNLWVKVKGGWSDDERALRSLGYGDL